MNPAGITGLPTAASREPDFDSFKTPIYALFNPGSGRRVTLVVNIHVGEADYFRRLKKKLLDLEAGGATIHYVQVDPPTDEQLAVTSLALRRLHDGAGRHAGITMVLVVAGRAHKRRIDPSGGQVPPLWRTPARGTVVLPCRPWLPAE